MSLPLLAALLALATSLLARRRRRKGALSLDDIALALLTHAGMVASAATLLAWVDHFSAASLAGLCVLGALGCWPWRLRRAPSSVCERPTHLVHTLALLALIALGIGLRTPTIPAPLAGRDQGSYMLRAELSLRTGSLDWEDELLAAAGQLQAEHPDAPAGHDLLGLFPGTDADWRAGHYEAAYRPGAYLADREGGQVVAQFFHLHPMLLASTGAALGRDRMAWVLPWLSGLWLLTLACCARRLWPRGPWAALALTLVACSPLAIWTGRTPLSETAHACFEWGAVLAALHLRPAREGADAREAWIVALMLAFSAGVRGNALLMLPVVLAVLWLRPRRPGRPLGGEAAAGLVLAGLVASVTLHAFTSYPYLHDELLRRGPELALGPASLVALAGLGALGWWVVDRELVDQGPARARLRAMMPKLLVLATFAAFVLWWHLRGAAEQARPFSRLDAAPALLGLPWLAAAGIGLIVVARRWRPARGLAGRRDAWLLALAAIVPATALLYAPRELPNLSFFYYGRYLVPELLPVAALLATAAIACIDGTLRRTRWGAPRARPWRVAASGLSTIFSLGLIASVAGPLFEFPQLRLREYAEAERAVDWLAGALPDDAAVIAGGEGWHHGHTYNQVGGALAMGEGVQVLPYRTREDAWVTAWDLLVATPALEPERRPVYLLVNEAAHNYTRADGARVAVLDDMLWPPFEAGELSLIELFVHALSPVEAEGLPTRVARHELRMGLSELRVDPEALAAIERLSLEGPTRAELGVSGGLHDDGRSCLSPDRALRVELPASDARHLVVFTAGLGDSALARRMPRLRITAAGEELAVEAPKGLRRRARASLGPLPLPESVEAGPWILELTAPKVPEDARAPGDCPFGRVMELVLLPRERGRRHREDIQALSFAPRETLGHPPAPAVWVRGRSLSRYRPGTRPEPKVRGLAMALPAGASLEFAPVDLPLDADGRPHTLELLVTLAGTTTPQGARLHLSVDGEALASIEVPAERSGSWIAEPIPWTPTRERARARLELESASGEVLVRDLALFVVGADLAVSELR